MYTLAYQASAKRDSTELFLSCPRAPATDVPAKSRQLPRPEGLDIAALPFCHYSALMCHVRSETLPGFHWQNATSIPVVSLCVQTNENAVGTLPPLRSPPGLRHPFPFKAQPGTLLGAYHWSNHAT